MIVVNVLWPGMVLGLLWVPSAINSRRPAVSTIAWILALVGVPYVGVLLYFLIGKTRMERRVRRRRRARRRMRDGLAEVRGGRARFRVRDEEVAEQLHPLGQGLARQAHALHASALTQGNRVEVLRDGAEKFPALLAALRGARQHIHLEYYIFEPDETGRQIIDALVERARAGVKVRVLVDAVGSFGAGRALFAPLEAAGGQVARFISTRLSLRQLDINFRNHRKIAVIDGRVGFTGGLNIGDCYSGLGSSGGGDAFHDLHLRLEGPAVLDLQETFCEDWLFATREDLLRDEHFPRPQLRGDALVQIVASGPDQEWPALHHIFFTAITQARERVWAMTPYFVPTEALVAALVAAAQRGVDVRIILPRRIDHMLVRLAGRSYYEELLLAGVRIFEYAPRMLHAKAMVVDGLWGTVGSCNMDVRSFQLNFEVNALFYSTLLARRLEGIFFEDLAQSDEIALSEVLKRSMPRRLAENTSRLFSPLL